jgi:hypothetical protein
LRIFKTKTFTRWAAKEGLSDDHLIGAVREMEQGLIDAELGGGVVKKRIGGRGRGKRGAFRTIIAYRSGTRAFFVHGFAKSTQDNLGPRELAGLKMLAKTYFTFDEEALDRSVATGALLEVALK